MEQIIALDQYSNKARTAKQQTKPKLTYKHDHSYSPNTMNVDEMLNPVEDADQQDQPDNPDQLGPSNQQY
jgi:hypothetical protein